MAVTVYLFDKFVANAFGGETAGESRKFDWLSDDIRVRLHTASYVPDRATHEFASDLTNELPTAGGYTAGGFALTGKTMTVDTVNHRVTFDADDAVWAAATLTARYASIVDAREAADANRELIGLIDFGENKSSVAVDYKVVFNALGIFRSTNAA